MMRDLLLPSILSASLCFLGACDSSESGDPSQDSSQGDGGSQSSNQANGSSPDAGNPTGGQPGQNGADQAAGIDPALDPALGWSYAGQTGPEFWGMLRSEWAMARRGKNQSPIHIYPDESRAVDVEPIKLEFGESTLAAARGPYFGSMSAVAGSQLNYGGLRLDLRRIEHRAPGEHKIGDEEYPAELQFHFIGQQRIIYIAVPLIVGETADPGVETLLKVWEAAPDRMDSETLTEVDLSPLNRTDTGTFRYPGSHTTPPCAEGVNWCVFKEPTKISADQLRRIEAIGKGCARPVQPLGARFVQSAF